MCSFFVPLKAERWITDGEVNTDLGHAPTTIGEKRLRKTRMTVNNMDKSASAKNLQPERKTDFKPQEKPCDFLVQSLRVCERATVES